MPFPSTAGAVHRLLTASHFFPLREVAELRSTCSFHSKGLREQYIRPERSHAARVQLHPYLGGVSYARSNEVDMFCVKWRGHWIRYDAEALQSQNNPLPPLERFLQPKLIFCQHSQRPRAFADFQGRWVTKDVFPLAIPRRPEYPLEWLAAVFNSTVFAMLYNTVYHGITIGGEFYHYLPAFLGDIPVPPRLPAGVAPDVHALQDALEHDQRDTARPIAERLDRAVSEAYGLSGRMLATARATHLDRLRIPSPWNS